MVGLVLVSHSKKLSQSVGELVAATTASPIPLATAGGTGDDHELFGTDALQIMEAIQSVSSSAGVLVLVDLGSAVLSAEAALELLGDEARSNVRVCPAPLVEGAVAAAAQVAIGATLGQVADEALSALLPKNEHLSDGAGRRAPGGPGDDAASVGSASTAQRRIVIRNAHGLHARPASRLVQTVGRFQADVTISDLSRNTGPVSGRSLNRVSTLGVLVGDEILVRATGPDADSAIEAIAALSEDNFGDREGEGDRAAAASKQRGSGLVAVSEGVAVGVAAHLPPAAPRIDTRKIADVNAEVKRLDTAIERATSEMDAQIARLKGALPGYELEIFRAHKAMLNDPDLHEDAVDAITNDMICAEYAWQQSIDRVRSRYEALEDGYLKSRASDVQDVGNQLLAHLAGSVARRMRFAEPTIIFARELKASETASMDGANVVGMITELGGPASHAAIIARGLGIPYITGFASIEAVKDGTLVVLSGFDGSVEVDPSAEVRDDYLARREHWLGEKKRFLEAAHSPAVTVDGATIAVFANIAGPEEARVAARAGADGVGLLRTEFLFLDRQSAPSEEEQYEALQEIGRSFAGMPVVVRTLDVGGDKVLPYVPMHHEENPFLGIRGVRLYGRIATLFHSHLRAILRAANDLEIRIMIPMIAQLDELDGVRGQLENAHAALQENGVPHRWPVATGIMVETPAAVELSDLFARRAEFFSIGTNDLTQYAMAADRGNASLAAYADAVHPAIIRSISRTVSAARKSGIRVSVCGEMAGDPEALPILLGIGVDEVSVSPARVPEVKDRIRRINRESAGRLVEELQGLESCAEVRKTVRRWWG